MWWVVVMACAGSDGSPEDGEAGVKPPWAEAVPTEHTVSGRFRARLGDELPGAGWWDDGQGVRADAARAWIRTPPDTTWPVIQIELLGRTPAGWDRLELDIGLQAWTAGPIPMNGTAAIGRVDRADGTSAWILGGELRVSSPGLADGDLVEGRFDELTLAVEP